LKVLVAREQESALTFLPTCQLFLFRPQLSGHQPIATFPCLMSDVLANSAGNEDRTFAAPSVLLALMAAIQRQWHGLIPSQVGPNWPNSLWPAYKSFRLNGGERGIRTLDRVSPIHAFQACAFNHSAISPVGDFGQLAKPHKPLSRSTPRISHA
jgi:hypothetical protein